MSSVKLVEVWRGDYLECVHRGHAVIANVQGDIIESWGNAQQEILPRSSCKILQALPLVTSGAADAFGLSSEQLALACSSHEGAAIHSDRVKSWLSTLDLGETDLRCGPQWPSDRPAKADLIKSDNSPCQIHNNCSGKHAGFLTLNKHLGGSEDYIDPNHPVQRAAQNAFEDMCGETSSGFAIDGCSAPNFSTSVTGLAKAMAKVGQDNAGKRLASAMSKHPLLVAGEGRACSELMSAMEGQVVVKTGAEGVFTAILPDHGLGVALKIEDGATRASEAVMAALLVKLGVLNADHPLVKKRMNPDILNRNKHVTGHIKPVAALM